MKSVKKIMIQEVMSEGESFILDIIRIIAASLVILGHGRLFFEIDLKYEMPIQNVGVIVFFALAGYLMSYSLLRNGQQTLFSYIKKKIVRIYPTLLPCLIFVALLDYIMLEVYEIVFEYAESYNIITFLGNVLMLQDMPFFGRFITSFGTARPLWTLSLEWWLYIFFAVVFYNVYQKETIRNSDLFLTVFLGMVAVTYLVAGRGNGLGTCFLCGMGIYCLVHKHNSNEINWLYVIGAIVAFGVIFVMGINHSEAYIYYNFFCISFLLLFVVLGFRNIAVNVRVKKTVSFIARSTFALYLTHYSIMYWIANVCKIQINNFELMVIAIIISWSVAGFITLMVENVRKMCCESGRKR